MNFEMMQKSFSGIFSVFNPTQPHIFVIDHLPFGITRLQDSEELGVDLIEEINNSLHQAGPVLARHSREPAWGALRLWPELVH